MELQKEMNDRLNIQINKELYSAYLYLSIAAKFDSMGYAGFSHWMKKQSGEEVEHAMKIFDYVGKKGGQVELDQIKRPDKNFTEVKEAFDASLAHEKFITKSIHELVDFAKDTNDKDTESFLQWFVDEQVEEEESVTEILDKFDKVQDSDDNINTLDKELSQR